MNEVFLDTVGLIALWDTSDQWHDAAQGAYQGLIDQPIQWVTTELILVECCNAAARRPYRNSVVALRDALASEGGIISVTNDDLEAAWKLFERGEADNAGIIDHISFRVMRRLGIRRALTNDRHFAAAGFEVLF